MRGVARRFEREVRIGPIARDLDVRQADAASEPCGGKRGVLRHSTRDGLVERQRRRRSLGDQASIRQREAQERAGEEAEQHGDIVGRNV